MDNKVFIVAEISANHGHDINIVKETIKVAKECGADAVKIQTYTPDTLTLNCNNKYFQIKEGTIWDGKILYDLYKEAYTPWEWHKELFDYAKKLDICLFSTPFDKTAVDLLESLENPIYKIASFEINDIPLIEYAASKKKPMIISTGVATEEEIKDAIEVCKKTGNYDITLLQCTSQYPAKLEDANLVMIEDLAKRFSVKSGLSDHTMGFLVPTTAVAMGAKVVEKHFILDRSIGGPDSSFSMLPSEFKEMVDNIRNVEKMIGKISYEISEKKESSLKFKRSLFVSKDIKKGEVITENNIKSVRPSNGISSKFYYDVLGKKVNRDLEFGTPLLFEYIEEESNE
ncbi:pseudaminic acid synthase [Fusobacterium canifelinum]|uniref:Pseudaminic acid synthase n=1 Tax=Fusobacterium canifelinum TaxID=285729 RepID=A0ABX7CEZ2_9FUSO|nr:pseudaminic acid synthase [Fusobacterium canifelinum]QQS88009.1 pseudaminic acid synthase [Fusobacterium canifelinum]